MLTLELHVGVRNLQQQQLPVFPQLETHPAIPLNAQAQRFEMRGRRDGRTWLLGIQKGS